MNFLVLLLFFSRRRLSRSALLRRVLSLDTSRAVSTETLACFIFISLFSRSNLASSCFICCAWALSMRLLSSCPWLVRCRRSRSHSWARWVPSRDDHWCICCTTSARTPPSSDSDTGPGESLGTSFSTARHCCFCTCCLSLWCRLRSPSSSLICLRRSFT
uniref:Uncharacterized protein n=1 Tax=Ixodes ricinus TaxID=34613 RepID=A0A6B0UWG7_IXORI